MTAAQVLILLGQSHLADVERLGQFNNLPGDAEQLATALVEAGVLTRWQADKLLTGKWKGFFLDEYTLLCHFRKTAISQEYVAEHTLGKHKVVLTIAPPMLVEKPGFLDHFCRESGNGQLRHWGSIYYLVRDWAEGDGVVE